MRLVGKGFTQVHGFEYNGTFNPMIKCYLIGTFLLEQQPMICT